MEDRKRRQEAPPQTNGGSGNRGVVSDRRQYLISACLRLLSVRPRSQDEIDRFLSKKTSDSQLKSEVENYLLEHKLLSDADFASWLVASRSRSRPRGKNLLIRELKNKGIPPEEISRVLPNRDAEVVLAHAALKKKLPVFERLGEREFRAKAGRFLMARGFSWDVIERVIKKGYNDDN